MKCEKDPTTCEKFVVGLMDWSPEIGKYKSEFPACVDPSSEKTLTIDDFCKRFSCKSLPKDSYSELFPNETIFRYVLNNEGKPIQVLYGNSAVYYADGKRIEKPVIFIKAKTWEEAVSKILKKNIQQL